MLKIDTGDMLPLSGISELLDLRAVTQAARSDGGRQPIWATQALGQPDGRINGGLMLFGSYCECTLMDDAAHEPLRRHHEWCCMHLCSLRALTFTAHGVIHGLLTAHLSAASLSLSLPPSLYVHVYVYSTLHHLDLAFE